MMVAAVAYLLVMTAGFMGALLILVRLFGEAPNTTRFQNSYGKKEDNEMSMFSGLETRGEINRLLDELYGGLGEAPRPEREAVSLVDQTSPAQEPIAEEEINEKLNAVEPVLAT